MSIAIAGTIVVLSNIGVLICLYLITKRQQESSRRIKKALVTAICIIQHDASVAGINGRTQTQENLNRWADELIEESGIDYDAELLAEHEEWEDDES